MVISGIKKSKKGWIEIVEVFIAILLLTGVLLVVIRSANSKENEIASKIYEKEVAILKDIELNNELRTEILSSNVPIEWDGFDSALPKTTERLNSLIPAYLECKAKICELNDACILNDFPKGSIYVKSLVISADADTYSPRQLKLFCRVK
ncbi:MAG: hypothetical protein ABIE36_02240 [Candidatus Diapherotrites archaeon]